MKSKNNVSSCRYFVLDYGILIYAKTPNDLARGRTHGRIDVGSAVITAKAEAKRIDLDDEECHHIKVRLLKLLYFK